MQYSSLIPHEVHLSVTYHLLFVKIYCILYRNILFSKLNGTS